MDKNYNVYKWLEAEAVKPKPNEAKILDKRASNNLKKAIHRRLDMLNFIDNPKYE